MNRHMVSDGRENGEQVGKGHKGHVLMWVCLEGTHRSVKGSLLISFLRELD